MRGEERREKAALHKAVDDAEEVSHAQAAQTIDKAVEEARQAKATAEQFDAHEMVGK